MPSPKKGVQFRDEIDWFVDTPDGKLTKRQEIFCWRYALHGNGIRAMRESFNRTTKNSQNQGTMNLLRRKKVINRIKVLLKQHYRGEIDINTGPWVYYKGELGDTGREITTPSRPLKYQEMLDRVNDEIEREAVDGNP